MRPKDLFGHLARNEWKYRQVAGWIAYQRRVVAGLAEHRVTTIEKPDGTEKVVIRLLLTPKGVACLAECGKLRAVAA